MGQQARRQYVTTSGPLKKTSQRRTVWCTGWNIQNCQMLRTGSLDLYMWSTALSLPLDLRTWCSCFGVHYPNGSAGPWIGPNLGQPHVRGWGGGSWWNWLGCQWPVWCSPNSCSSVTGRRQLKFDMKPKFCRLNCPTCGQAPNPWSCLFWGKGPYCGCSLGIRSCQGSHRGWSRVRMTKQKGERKKNCRLKLLHSG